MFLSYNIIQCNAMRDLSLVIHNSYIRCQALRAPAGQGPCNVRRSPAECCICSGSRPLKAVQRSDRTVRSAVGKAARRSAKRAGCQQVSFASLTCEVRLTRPTDKQPRAAELQGRKKKQLTAELQGRDKNQLIYKEERKNN